MNIKVLIQVATLCAFSLSQGAAHGAGDPIETAKDEVDSTIEYLRSTELDAEQNKALTAVLDRVRRSSVASIVRIEAECYRAGCVVVFASKDVSDLRRISSSSKSALNRWNGVKLWAPIVEGAESLLVVALVGSLG